VFITDESRLARLRFDIIVLEADIASFVEFESDDDQDESESRYTEFVNTVLPQQAAWRGKLEQIQEQYNLLQDDILSQEEYAKL
jgi:hypothetical protein